MNNDNYVVIQGWMCNKLNLSGNELLVFALIYGFSQDGESEFRGSRSYIAKTFNITKPTVDKAIKGLIEKGLVIKSIITINDMQFNKYKISLQGVKNLYGGGKEILPPSKETLQGGGKESLPNNINNNISNNIASNKRESEQIPPTLDQVKEYCKERHNGIDAQRFIDFYESKGWMIGKNKMKSWKACVRTWEKSSQEVVKSDSRDEKFEELERRWQECLDV